MQQVAGRLAAGQSLQLYGHARILDVGGLVAEQRAFAAHAAGAAEDDGRAELAQAILRLSAAGERSLVGQVQGSGALSVRWVLVCPWARDGAAQGAEESLRHVEGIGMPWVRRRPSFVD